MKQTLQDQDPFFEIAYYHDYISPKLARTILASSKSIDGVDGLKHLGVEGGLESKASLEFLVKLYQSIKTDLSQVLRKRIQDRKFIDERVKACYEFNRKLSRDFLGPNYKTIIGLEDADGRIVVGPKSHKYCEPGGVKVAPIPDHLKGPHVTLFGPPDSAKMSINAMNSIHRKLAGEPSIVEQLLAKQMAVPMWGADDEDSKTPLRADLIDAAVNLTDCFDGSLTYSEKGKNYNLAESKLAQPIKRFPGLALPCTFLFFDKNPIPLHLYDFALHLFSNWHNEKALTFYVPKLENEEEARYIHTMISQAEGMIKKLHPEYRLGTVRLMIVLENPRAILRTHEIMDELYPYFAGASLGWHDYLGSTARLFKEDANYRIPVKADPYIVIKYIKASHRILADVVGSRGGIKVGGMYGILPQQNDIQSPSFQVTLKGYFKDVVTQLKRDLTGFWVAHPDFVRLGLAIVQAWKQYQAGDKSSLMTLTREIFTEDHRKDVDAFIEGDDIEGLDPADPNYVRSLLVADLKESDYIPNHHPEEIRYNVFQCLQYLTDWLSGNGCVALPTTIEGVPVRVMDDLATAERSRWEVWHEIYHGRFKVEDFLRIAHEELHFIRKDLSNPKKIVQVKWDERTAKWYPVAFKLMIKLMTDEKPVEFASELLLPFTLEEVRQAPDPWSKLMVLDDSHYQMSDYVQRFDYYFECCGTQRFATEMATTPMLDLKRAEDIIKSFTIREIIEAASFHGDIGESAETLDSLAKMEQELVLKDQQSLVADLRSLGHEYQKKFGFKFLISAKGKSASEILSVLKIRLNNSQDVEVANAQGSLWEITRKRITVRPIDQVYSEISRLLKEHEVDGVQIALATSFGHQTIATGNLSKGGAPVSSHSLFELASLSKTLATAFAMDFFERYKISLDDRVNELLSRSRSTFRLKSAKDPSWADQVQVKHLFNHQALNLHYVKGFANHQPIPKTEDILIYPDKFGYEPVFVISKPGTKFGYSGAGFLVLEHLIEELAAESIERLTTDFLLKVGLNHTSFVPKDDSANMAHGYRDDGTIITGGWLRFPAFAAGAVGTAEDMLKFLKRLSTAYHNLDGALGVSHDTAVSMMQGRDMGCREFMGCEIGLGVFVAQMGENKVILHQGANDGFRAIYLYAVAGPDVGKGFVILCNADNRGVLFNAEVAKILIRHLGFTGVDHNKFRDSFDWKNLTQEQIVNIGYKKLIFDSFKKTLPENIIETGPRDRLAEFNLLTEATVHSVSCERFARATNLFSPFEPVFDPELFGNQGKIMDSWETVRHNDSDRDTLHLKLKHPGDVFFARISTKFHDGNHPQFVRVLGRVHSSDEWIEIIPKISMEGHSFRCISLGSPMLNISEVMVEQYPDGGLTRLGLYSRLPKEEATAYVSVSQSRCVRFKDMIPKVKKPLSIPYDANTDEVTENFKKVERRDVDFASAAFGGKVIHATNEHYGPAAQVISPFPPLNMFDGLESARSRVEGHFDEVTIQFGQSMTPRRVILDFKYFVNNNPKAIEILVKTPSDWTRVAGPIPVKAFAANKKEIVLQTAVKTDQMKVRTLPDGGINRIHVYE